MLDMARAGTVRSTTLIWTTGMANWVPAASTELRDSIADAQKDISSSGQRASAAAQSAPADRGRSAQYAGHMNVSSDQKAQPTSEQLLQEYRKTAAGPVSAVGGGPVSAIKRAWQVFRLKREAAGLQRAHSDLLEKIGILTLQHRPASVDVSDEMADLGGVQSEMNKQQATIDALRGSKGSESVVRECTKQVKALRDRQRQLMIAAGSKAEAVRAEMPDAVGRYLALDALRAGLAQRQATLRQLGESESMAAEEQLSTNSLTHTPLLFISPAVFAVIILCFFMPFFDISCEGRKVADLSGFKVVFYPVLQQEKGPTSSFMMESARAKPGSQLNYAQMDAKDWLLGWLPAVLVLAAAFLGIVFGIRRKPNVALTSAVVGLAGFLFTIIWRIGMGFAMTPAEAKDAQISINISLAAGAYFVLILFLGVSAFNGYFHFNSEKP
jgi:hypothetical protein